MVGCVFALLSWSGVARATYSIAATDRQSGQVGGAGTSCVGGLDVAIIFAAAPGTGVIHAQSAVNTRARDLGAQMLGSGATPEEVIARITAADYDAQAETRQYGVVDLDGRAAAFTGSGAFPYANHQTGADGGFSYAVQGNLLTGKAVLDQARAAFIERGGCDLADRLMLALEAGAENGQGDGRCTPQRPSDAAFIRVDNADGSTYLSLSTIEPTANPLVSLRAAYDSWRAQNPCPALTGPGPDAGPCDGDAGSPAGNPGGASPSSAGGCSYHLDETGSSLPDAALIAAVTLVASRRRRRSTNS
jgi:uncharacterized Ntn-hydrolase superfamily protein